MPRLTADNHGDDDCFFGEIAAGLARFGRSESSHMVRQMAPAGVCQIVSGADWAAYLEAGPAHMAGNGPEPIAIGTCRSLGADGWPCGRVFACVGEGRAPNLSQDRRRWPTAPAAGRRGEDPFPQHRHGRPHAAGVARAATACRWIRGSVNGSIGMAADADALRCSRTKRLRQAGRHGTLPTIGGLQFTHPDPKHKNRVASTGEDLLVGNGHLGGADKA
jgi:hypothetical protein